MIRRWIEFSCVAALLVARGAAAADVSGMWHVSARPDFAMLGPQLWTFTQTGTAVDLSPGMLSGTIDVSSGAFFFDLGVPSPPCPLSVDLSGAVAADDRTFWATETVVRPACMGTFPLIGYSGVRCLNEPLLPEDCETPFTTLSGRKLIVRDRDGAPSKRRIVVLSRDPAIEAPVPFTGSDPRRGATLVLARGDQEIASLPLAGANWVAFENRAGATGYRYFDPSPSSLCRHALLRAGALRVACKGAGIPFTLDEAAQGTLAVTLAVADGPRFCMEFGGVVRDVPALPAGPSGVFKARDSAAPASCTPAIFWP